MGLLWWLSLSCYERVGSQLGSKKIVGCASLPGQILFEFFLGFYSKDAASIIAAPRVRDPILHNKYNRHTRIFFGET